MSDLHLAAVPEPPPWPATWVPAGEFAAYAAARAQPGVAASEAHRQDLYLACACVRGVTAAIEAFEAGYASEIAASLQRLRLAPDDVAELTQVLRKELIVGEGSTGPSLASYSGRGSLSAWLRVTATRKGLKAIRREPARAHATEEDALVEPSAGDDPELAYLRSMYGEAFRAAFVAAMGKLDDLDKNVLRQHFIDGLTIDDLAALHRVHRATAARWIAAARKRLLLSTRREFALQANVSAFECDSVIRLLQSRLDVTWRRLLA